jgi:pimeloyl-ACP methyl ester carboxylesterase
MARNTHQPATVSSSDDRTVAYTEYGSPDGTPVLFFHGTPGSRRFAKLFDTVAESQGIRLLAFDRPGYGQSPPWPERTVRDTTRIVFAVLDDADVDTADVIAFSGGAPYAFASAATQPDRIDRLDVVAGAIPTHVTDAQPFAQRLLGGMATTTPRLLRAAFRTQAWLARHRDPSFVVGQYTTGDAAETVPESAAAIVREDFLEAFANHRSGAVTEFRHAASDWNVAFDDIDADVRLWHGTDDTNVPLSGVRRFESELQTAELRVIDDADHLQTVLRSVPDIFASYS